MSLPGFRIERLGYSAESRRKVVRLRPGIAIRQLEKVNSFCQPSSKWVPFSNLGRISSESRGMGSPIISFAQDIIGL